MRGDTNERPVWRSVIHETIAAETPFFTDAAGVVDKVLLRESVDDSLHRRADEVDRLFTADARRNTIREEINRHFSASRAQYVARDREARDVSRRAAYYRQAVQIPLGGSTYVLKPRIACTLADCRLMANYWAKRQRHDEREGRWWGSVVARMERHGCAEDAPITAVVRVNEDLAAQMYRTVDCATWGDPWFEEQKPAGKLLFLYLITNSRANMCGAYPITLRTISNETGMTPEAVAALLETFGAGDLPRVVWWPDLHYIFVRNFYRHQRANSSDKYRIGAAKQAGDLPVLVRESVCIAYPELRPAEIPPDRVSVGVSIEQIKTDTDQSKDKEKPPTPLRGGGERGIPLPSPFLVADRDYEWASAGGLTDEDIHAATLEFVDYWRGVPGARARKLDWGGTWRNSVRAWARKNRRKFVEKAA